MNKCTRVITYTKQQVITDIPDSNFPNAAGAGPSQIYELKYGRGQGQSRILEKFIEIMPHIILQTPSQC